MNFATLQDALTFAMEKEKKANELYLLFRGKVKDEGARTLLQELADQEMGHWRMIREALESGSVEGIAAKAKGRDIQLSDTMIEIDLTPDSTPQDIMVFAMQMEKKALDFYAGLRDRYRGTDLEALFDRLAREEMRHKEILEKQYAERFEQWM